MERSSPLQRAVEPGAEGPWRGVQVRPAAGGRSRPRVTSAPGPVHTPGWEGLLSCAEPVPGALGLLSGKKAPSCTNAGRVTQAECSVP